MNDPKKQIGERISLLRRSRGMTQNELAEKVSLDGRHISRLETGKYFPSLDTLVSMAEAMEIPLQEFFLFPTEESEHQMREAMVEIAHQAPVPLIKEILSFARNQSAIWERTQAAREAGQTVE
ncbi:helix-turn-helix transcriptional regulator [Alcanivorax sp.]|uniref:helix-turn-helix domain-containing protein n=1 Tax=Alcanivorax sp. TaxID=1872427 RepID=UPI0025C15FF3|nr:helix-turn-helix transcriptional regulator [Alcanivorax sp.]